jgi:hypothetical protein
LYPSFGYSSQEGEPAASEWGASKSLRRRSSGLGDEPDGYTILVVFSSYVVNPTLFDKIPYDPNKDFDPVILL